jgi:hypothetical protein
VQRPVNARLEKTFDETYRSTCTPFADLKTA